MRVAALYDIHGNLPALEAVLAEVERSNIDLIVIGGDVLPGPLPRESLTRLLEITTPLQFILGNGDRKTLDPDGEIPEAYRATVEWNGGQLSEELRQFIASWPATFRIDIPGLGDVLFCHATPTSDTRIFTVRTSESDLVEEFGSAAASVVVCGHTHMQFDRIIGGTRVVNAGSVGVPFGERGAYWLELDTQIHLRHVAYNYDEAAARIRASSDPNAEQAAMGVLNPPSAATMLDVFTPHTGSRK